jgi:hypothetical protein
MAASWVLYSPQLSCTATYLTIHVTHGASKFFQDKDCAHTALLVLKEAHSGPGLSTSQISSHLLEMGLLYYGIDQENKVTEVGMCPR